MDLEKLFNLEPHGADTFVGIGPQYPWGGLYGGQIVAQSLRAAAATVDDGLDVHSLRSYFIRRGDHTEPVRYEVDRIRNGRSFVTRRVVARQAIGAILNLEASFQRPEPSLDVQTIAMPAGIARPEELLGESWMPAFERRSVPTERLHGILPAGVGAVAAWMRVNGALSDDELIHRCWLAYLSDDLPFDSVRELFRSMASSVDGIDADYGLLSSSDHQSYGASLDHSIWFHRPIRVDEWHLYEFMTHGYVGGRGLTTGHVFRADGVLAATVAQEILLRPIRDDKTASHG
ncbi:MAG: acyl-CoA thioesterase domain-containing protein [Ilumatobacteraceae bacterium]